LELLEAETSYLAHTLKSRHVLANTQQIVPLSGRSQDHGT